MFTASSSLTPRKDVYPFISAERFESALADDVVIVTGAGRGIGRTVALAFAAAGASVCVVARRKLDLDAVVDEIKATYNSPALAIAADVSMPTSAIEIVSKVKEVLGPVSILVNNAGVTRFNAFELEPEPIEDWWRVVEVNLRGPVSFTRAVLPTMLERERGVIISLVSTSGSLDIPFNTAYATSKAALIKFHQDLEVEVRDRGVCNFAIHPGTVQTDLSTATGAINMEATKKFPQMQDMFNANQSYEYETPALVANTMVALCADRRATLLSGRYVDSQFDIEEVIQELEKGTGNKVEENRLYRLKMDEL